jgi:hypothetical protein
VEEEEETYNGIYRGYSFMASDGDTATFITDVYNGALVIVIDTSEPEIISSKTITIGSGRYAIGISSMINDDTVGMVFNYEAPIDLAADEVIYNDCPP